MFKALLVSKHAYLSHVVFKLSPILIYVHMQENFTPLWLASITGEKDTVKLLITAKANLHLANEVRVL